MGRLKFAVLLVLALTACAGEAGLQGPEAQAPPGLEPIVAASPVTSLPPTGPSTDPGAPSLDMLITKSMLYEAGLRHGVNPYLVMGLAWWESGWNASAVSSAGAIGIMQVMPATAAVDGPKLLNRTVDLTDPQDNIDMGTASSAPTTRCASTTALRQASTPTTPRPSITSSPQPPVDSPAPWVARWRRAGSTQVRASSRLKPKARYTSRTKFSSSSGSG
jgi:hypothetical protein